MGNLIVGILCASLMLGNVAYIGESEVVVVETVEAVENVEYVENKEYVEKAEYPIIK